MYKEEKNIHSHDCRYKDDDMLLYAYLEIHNQWCLLSANEVSVFDEYLEYAHNDDKNINIDFDRNDKSPYQLVYGGVMYREDIDSGKVESYLESNIGCALIDLDGESDCDLIASQYEAIKLYKNHAKGNWMPFVALMRTHHTLNDAEYSITMFPYTGNYVWECMVNKVLLLACRKTVAIDGLNPLNWEQYIDEELLMRTFSVADLYIPKSDTEESVV
jgi:hypothetical protein